MSYPIQVLFQISAETIRIFRRTRSGRRDELDLNGGEEVTSLGHVTSSAVSHRSKPEELPPPESPAAAKEANVK